MVCSYPRSKFLRCREYDDLVDADIGRLLDGEDDRPSHRACRNGCLIEFHHVGLRGPVVVNFRSLSIAPGSMDVTRTLEPTSWRRPSETTRTANLVPGIDRAAG